MVRIDSLESGRAVNRARFQAEPQHGSETGPRVIASGAAGLATAEKAGHGWEAGASLRPNIGNPSGKQIP